MSKWLAFLAILLIPAYIFRLKVFGLPTNIFEVSVLVLLISVIIEKLVDSRLHENGGRLTFGDWRVYLLITAAAVGVVVATDKTTALGILKGWFIVPAVFYFCLLNIFDRKNIWQISIPIFIDLLLVSAWAICQRFGAVSGLFYQQNDPGFSDYLFNLRSFGPFESPNYLAMFLVPSSFLSLGIFSRLKAPIDKILFLVTFIFPLFALYYSKSVGGFLAAGLSIIIFIIFLIIKRKARKVSPFWTLGTAAAAGIIAGLAYWFGLTSFNQNLRIKIWDYSWQIFRSHPIFGVGLGGFYSAVKAVSAPDAYFQAHVLPYAIHPQSLYVDLWLSMGVFGLVIFLYIVWIALANLGQAKSNLILAAGAFAGLSAILIHGIVDTTYFKNDLSAIFWLILALATIIGEKNVGKSK